MENFQYLVHEDFAKVRKEEWAAACTHKKPVEE
jgi:hypothetical protein